MTTFLLIRHATNDLVGRAIAGRMPGVHLNEEGRRQAEGLADRLAREPIGAIYRGPLERAAETAKPLAIRLGLEPIVAGEIDEIDFGEWTGRTLEQLHPIPGWRRFNDFRSGTRAPGGESMLEAQARIVEFLHRLRDERPGEVVSLIGHGDVIKAAVAYYLGVPLDLFQRIEIEPASTTGIEIGDDGARILYVNRPWSG